MVKFRKDITVPFTAPDPYGVHEIRTLAKRGSVGYVRKITTFYGRPLYHVEMYPVGKKPYIVKADEDDLAISSSGGFQENPGVTYHPPRPGNPTKVLKDGGASYVENASPLSEGKKQKMLLSEFEKHLKANGTPEQIALYEKTKEAYKKFHHGTLPKYVVRRVVDVGAGDQIIGTSFTYSMGKSPFDSYITPKGSKKGDNTPYLHEWTTQPEALATAKGKLVMKPLDGGAKITDWMHG